MMTLKTLAGQLAAGDTTSRALVEACLVRIADENGEGRRAFIAAHEEAARAEADEIDRLRALGVAPSPFAGVPLAIKDLFDLAGNRTRAGSRLLEAAPFKTQDAPAIAHLRRAGFVMIGRTNMTEFAFGAFGINPHYGTPRAPFDRATGRIPGGSTSGGAVAVADGMAAAAIGSDTGGSCRIPAAFCGVVGFKPTSWRVSRDGVFPLSKTLDSIGPLANSAECCAILDSWLAGGQGESAPEMPAAGLRIGRIDGYVDSHIEAPVAEAYEAALKRLADAGALILPLKIPELFELPEINKNGGILGAEALALHRKTVATGRAMIDPWVLARIEAAKGQSAVDYLDVLAHRARIIEAARRRALPFDVLAAPTVQILPPPIATIGPYEQSAATNQLITRNTVIANFLDRPSISIPASGPGEPPVGFMLIGESGEDRKLFAIAAALEPIVRPRSEESGTELPRV